MSKEINQTHLITIRSFENPIDAHLLKTKLEDEGIPCVVFDENMITLNPLFNVSVGGIKLKVHEHDIDRAMEVTKEYDNAPVTDEQDHVVQCPDCGSHELYTGFRSMKGWKGILSTIISFVLVVFPIHINTVYRCKECGCEFRPEPDSAQ